MMYNIQTLGVRLCVTQDPIKSQLSWQLLPGVLLSYSHIKLTRMTTSTGRLQRTFAVSCFQAG